MNMFETPKKIRVWQVIGGRWVVDCPSCSEDFLFSIMTAPWAKEWRTAFDWAFTHSQHHGMTRCLTCGHCGRLDEYVKYGGTATMGSP